MKAFNINDKLYPFTEWILDGKKLIETRKSNSLKSLVGQRVGIIRTGKGKAMLVGYVTITRVEMCIGKKWFDEDYKRHLVPSGSIYASEPKHHVYYMYYLADPERCEPIPVSARGIVIRNI